MNPVLSFVHQHWIQCVHVNRHLDDNVVDYYECEDRTAFSCFFVPGYIGDLFRIDADQYHRKFTDCRLTILDELKPSRMFILDIHNHVFTILYLSDAEIYYIDYYCETGRKEVFRIEILTLNQLQSYIVALQQLDFRAIAEFNQFWNPERCAAELKRTYWSTLERLSQIPPGESSMFDWMIVDRSYLEGAYYHEITHHPTMDDILRVAHQSRDYLRSYIDSEPEVMAAISTDIAYLESAVAVAH